MARNWALTTAHLFDRPDAAGYSLRFSVVNDQTDATDTTNLRAIDLIVPHPDLVDLALVHFNDPVPEGTWIPRLANMEPGVLDFAQMYGWGTATGTLTRYPTLIITPRASQNAGFLRTHDRYFEVTFRDFDPMVTLANLHPLDEGSGTFSPRGVLTGVQFGNAPYRDEANFTANPPFFQVAYEIPVWKFRTWIQSVIHGEGTSSSSSQHDELRRRRLTEIPKEPSLAEGSGLPMTPPPPIDTCDEGETSCTLPDPTWAQAVLLGSGNNRGTVLGRCVQASGNSCSFNGTKHAGGATAWMPLGPSKAIEALGTRQVMVWCKASNTFSDGAPSRPVLRVSFTNADPEQVPIGMGWWDVMPDQVGTGTDQTLVDPARFATC